MIKIGQSCDIHRLVAGRDLILGGVKIPHAKGLLGHSDADVLLHAIIEAVIGALGLKDIGTHFSDQDPQYAGISSLVLLEKTYEMMKERGYHVVNLDSLVLIEKPKLAPYLAQMRQNIAETLHCKAESVNVKATCAEGLGFIGQEEGAQAFAVVLISNDPA